MTACLPTEVSAALSQPGVREQLGAFARHLRYQHTVSSTNDLAIEWARTGAPDGTTLLASAQTAGRGRRGREWYSPADSGIYVSVVLRGGCRAPVLTLLAGVATAEGIRAATGLPVELEWPNDLVIDDWRRDEAAHHGKVGGILCEACEEPEMAPAVVVGIGINLVTVDYPAEIGGRAAALDAYLGRPIDRGALLVSCLRALAVWRRRYVDDGATLVLDRWRELSPSSDGELVRWVEGDGWRTGRTAGIDVDGALLVRLGGRTERIVGGTVEWLSR